MGKREDSNFLAAKRHAIVTGSNKGIGLEVCKQLASKGVMVVLTARDENKGIKAMKTLKDYYICRPENLVFHQLDVLDPTSISCLVDFVKTKYGKLDILVNNAGILGLSVDINALEASKNSENSGYIKWGKVSTQPYDLGEECITTNYYGAKRMAEAFMPLLSLSDSPRIVNVSSSSGKLEYVINEWACNILNDTKALNEERIDKVLEVFLKDWQEDSLKTKSWPSFLSAYTLSKAAMNAYTRLVAKKHPNVFINSVCPGYVKTSLNFFRGHLSVEEGAHSVVKLVLLPMDGQSLLGLLGSSSLSGCAMNITGQRFLSSCDKDANVDVVKRARIIMEATFPKSGLGDQNVMSLNTVAQCMREVEEPLTSVSGGKGDSSNLAMSDGMFDDT
nr:(+)-neomenthol dehydrogenase-like [Tanacetum cinerariifolium]